MKEKISILVVEDDIIICEDIKSSLVKMGYNLLDTVTSGEAAIEIIKQEKPDFIMMDIVLRGRLNGIETAELITKEYHIPIIFLSAYSDPITMKRTEATNPYGYLAKPFHADELKEVLEKAIARRKEEMKKDQRLKIKDEKRDKEIGE